MNHYRDETRAVRVLDDVVCNRCGKSCRVEGGNFECASVRVDWGYGSGKDGTREAWDLCEACHDEVVAAFKIPPDTAEYNIGDPL